MIYIAGYMTMIVNYRKSFCNVEAGIYKETIIGIWKLHSIRRPLSIELHTQECLLLRLIPANQCHFVAASAGIELE